MARSLHIICHEANLSHMMLGLEANEPEYYAQAFPVAVLTIVLVVALFIGSRIGAWRTVPEHSIFWSP